MTVVIWEMRWGGNMVILLKCEMNEIKKLDATEANFHSLEGVGAYRNKTSSSFPLPYVICSIGSLERIKNSVSHDMTIQIIDSMHFTVQEYLC